MIKNIYILVVYIIFNMFIPSAQYFLFQGRHSLNANISIEWFASNIVVFPFVGYLLTCRLRGFWNVKKILILWGINIGAILMSSYLTYYRAKIMGVCDEKNSQLFHDTFVLINCVEVFVSCQYLNEHSSILKKIEKLVVSIGGSTFGIYLLHIYIKDHTRVSNYIWKIFREKMNMSPMVYAFFYCGIIFMCGYIITIIMKKIPLLRRLVS